MADSAARVLGTNVGKQEKGEQAWGGRGEGSGGGRGSGRGGGCKGDKVALYG